MVILGEIRGGKEFEYSEQKISPLSTPLSKKGPTCLHANSDCMGELTVLIPEL
jgi:hypothetical protein